MLRDAAGKIRTCVQRRKFCEGRSVLGSTQQAKPRLVPSAVFCSGRASIIRHSRKLAYGSDSSLGVGN